MKTLFIDTHSSKLDFTLIDGDNIVSVIKDEVINHSENAIPSLIELLDKCNIKLEDIDEIVVVNGPGSFTGVRIGVTIAKTIAYSLDIPIKTITSLEASGVSSKEKYDVVTVRDPKGYYSALKDSGCFKDYCYYKSVDFDSYIQKNGYKFIDECTYDYKSILDYLKDKDYTLAHVVNPIYIKEIDVLK